MGKITINQDSLKSRREFKRFKLKDGANVYRILPPFGDVEVHNNYPYRKWSTAWMLDPRSGSRRPFASPMTDGSQECPVKEYNDALTKFIERKKKALEDNDYTKEEIKTELEDLYQIQWQLKVTHTYAYNAADKSGELGLLEVKSTAHQGIKKMMNTYIKEYGQDPTCLESDIKENAGVWINITKEGEKKDTEYNVAFSQIKKKTADGEIIKVDDRLPLSDNIVDNYTDLAYDLSTLYVRKTYDELKEILLFNLAMLSKATPECVLPGYNIEGLIEEEVQEKPAKRVSVVIEEPVVAKKKIAIQIDDCDEEEAPKPVKRAVAAAPVASMKMAKTKSYSSDEVMQMAEDILEG